MIFKTQWYTHAHTYTHTATIQPDGSKLLATTKCWNRLSPDYRLWCRKRPTQSYCDMINDNLLPSCYQIEMYFAIVSFVEIHSQHRRRRRRFVYCWRVEEAPSQRPLAFGHVLVCSIALTVLVVRLRISRITGEINLWMFLHTLMCHMDGCKHARTDEGKITRLFDDESELTYWKLPIYEMR